jgi:hypothetical protein
MKKIVSNLSKKWGPLIFFSILIISVFFLNSSLLKKSKAVINDHELRFSESSLNLNLEGSVVPASCESYPTTGFSHYTGDGGHCAGTCPAGTALVDIPWYRFCQYSWWEWDQGQLTEYSTGPANEPCPLKYNGHDYTGVYFDYNANICRQTCWNGSMVFPHLGQTCPPAPVNGICSATHYNCAAGTSVNNTSGVSTWTWSCNGANGGSNVSCLENKPTPTGSLNLSASTCSINPGSNTCTVSATWTTTNPQTTSAITTNQPAPNTILYNSNSGGPSPVSLVGQTTQTFYLYNNGVLLDSKIVTSSCASGSSWDTLYSRCTNPQVDLPIDLVGQYYPPGTLKFSCLNSTHYTILRYVGAPTNDFVVHTATTSYVGEVTSTLVSGTNYILRCLSGNVPDDYPTTYNATPGPTEIKLDITPRTISPEEKVLVTWDTKFPTSACSLYAKVVCANNACSALQLAASSTLNAILNATTTDPNDPATSRNLQTAIKTVAPGHKDNDVPIINLDWKALGKKTLQIRYTTDLVYDCGASGKETRRIQVTRSEEQ